MGATLTEQRRVTDDASWGVNVFCRGRDRTVLGE